MSNCPIFMAVKLACSSDCTSPIIITWLPAVWLLCRSISLYVSACLSLLYTAYDIQSFHVFGLIPVRLWAFSADSLSECMGELIISALYYGSNSSRWAIGVATRSDLTELATMSRLTSQWERGEKRCSFNWLWLNYSSSNIKTTRIQYGFIALSKRKQRAKRM